MNPDEFQLYDLTICVESIGGQCTCAMAVGDRFCLQGGKISLPDGADFCLYALQAAIPLLPAKQRRNHAADWMETDSRVICPDPACKLIMRIDRTATRTLKHDEVSPIPWEHVTGDGEDSAAGDSAAGDSAAGESVADDDITGSGR